jgi:Trk K+ transport system NAD-binding subunit
LLRARLAGALEFRRIPDSGHVVICGLGNIGFCTVQELVRYEERVVVIEQSKDSRFVTTARRLGVPVLIGDATVAGVLEQAHVRGSRAVVAATSDDLVNLQVALMARDLRPTQRVILHLSDPQLAQMLREAANIRLALSIPYLAAPAFVAALFGDRVQSVFMIDGRLLATFDLLVAADDMLAGQTVRAVSVDYALLPVAVLDKQGAPLPEAASVRLQPGFRLIAITRLRDLERLLRRDPVRREFAVHLTSYQPPARPAVATLLRECQGCSAEAVERFLEQLPICLGSPLTRGQAEDLISQLPHEQVDMQIVQTDVVS